MLTQCSYPWKYHGQQAPSGGINKQKWHTSRTANLFKRHQVVNVWAAVHAETFIGSFFFDGNLCLEVDSLCLFSNPWKWSCQLLASIKRHRVSLYIKLFSVCNEDSLDVWCQKRDIRFEFKHLDLTPLELIYWSIFRNKTANIDELKANSHADIVAKSPEKFKKVMENAAKRINFAVFN